MAPTAPARDVSPTPPGGPRLRRTTKNRIVGLLFVSPAIVLMLVVIAYPLIYGIALGFFDVNTFTLEMAFTGLDNFASALTGGPEFVNALGRTVMWAVATVVVQVVAGVGLAMLLNRRLWGQGALRMMAIMPYLLPVVSVTTVWKWMLDESRGVVNHGLEAIGLSGVPWLSSPRMAFVTLVLISGWRLFPFILIAILGRLQSIPIELNEAARCDGATSWQVFWHVTLPQLRGVLVVTAFLRFIWDFNEFDVIALLTGGGPARSTETLPLLIYGELFHGAGPGQAAAIADLVLIVLAVFCVLYFRVNRSEANE